MMVLQKSKASSDSNLISKVKINTTHVHFNEAAQYQRLGTVGTDNIQELARAHNAPSQDSQLTVSTVGPSISQRGGRSLRSQYQSTIIAEQIRSSIYPTKISEERVNDLNILFGQEDKAVASKISGVGEQQKFIKHLNDVFDRYNENPMERKSNPFLAYDLHCRLRPKETVLTRFIFPDCDLYGDYIQFREAALSIYGLTLDSWADRLQRAKTGRRRRMSTLQYGTTVLKECFRGGPDMPRFPITLENIQKEMKYLSDHSLYSTLPVLDIDKVKYFLKALIQLDKTPQSLLRSRNE